MSWFNETLKDIKMEAVAAGLLSAGLHPEQLLFKTLGAFRRKAGKDLVQIQSTEIGNFRGVVLELNRDGIYDALPEQLFHLKLAPTLTLEEKIREIQLEREKEQKARLFFLPLEQELAWLKVWIEQIEQSGAELERSDHFLMMLRQFWGIPELVCRTWFNQLIPVLPSIAEYAGDVAATEQLLSRLLREEVHLKKGASVKVKAVEPVQVGRGLLGMNWVLPGEIDTYIPSSEICIYLTDSKKVPLFLPGSPTMKQLDWLVDWLFPVESEVIIRVEVSGSILPFLLQDEDCFAFLGYSIQV